MYKDESRQYKEYTLTTYLVIRKAFNNVNAKPIKEALIRIDLEELFMH